MNEGLENRLRALAEEDPRFHLDAYHFVGEALDYTVKRENRLHPGRGTQHVNGRTLSEGLREYALTRFGPMAITVLNEWGIRTTAHIGLLVDKMVNAGILGKQPEDDIADFNDVYDFHEAFVKPFEPPARR